MAKRVKIDTTNASNSEAARIVFFQNIDPRRMPELLDSTLISQDNAKISNLSDKFIHASGRFAREYY